MATKKKQLYRLKGTFPSKGGKTFVRYWCNSQSLTGWLFPEAKDRANTYTRSAGQKMLTSPKRNKTVLYELEPVT